MLGPALRFTRRRSRPRLNNWWSKREQTCDIVERGMFVCVCTSWSYHDCNLESSASVCRRTDDEMEVHGCAVVDYLVDDAYATLLIN